MNIEKRQEIERKVVRKLIRSMKDAGWVITRINDGGEPDEDTLNPNETEAMDAVFGVDESTIYFHKASPFRGKPGGKTHFAVIILGNDGWDCIADHSCSNHALAYDDFEQVMDKVVYPYCDKLSSQK